MRFGADPDGWHDYHCTWCTLSFVNTEITTTYMRAHLSEVIDQIRGTYDVVTLIRNGRRVAMLMDPDVYDQIKKKAV